MLLLSLLLLKCAEYSDSDTIKAFTEKDKCGRYIDVLMSTLRAK